MKKISPRSTAIDALRGGVVVLMALDHARDFFCQTGLNPTDFSQISAALFLTRWISHLCAPTFFFLAGVGARLSLSAHFSPAHLTRFLWRRGAWTALLGLTVANFAWTFSFYPPALEILWALGIAMIVLAGVHRLPLPLIVTFGAVLVVGHNAFDSVPPEAFGSFAALWKILHVLGGLWPGVAFPPSGVVYPLVPWIGVMPLGFAFGAFWQRSSPQRTTHTAWLGLALLVGFIGLRAGNGYGDPHPWAKQPERLRTVFSFINCAKYPPSLAYLLLTLGSSLLLLAGFERFPSWQNRAVLTFGRVPLFFYFVHLYLLHAGALLLLRWQVGVVASADVLFAAPPAYGLSLLGAYGVWLGTLLLLYPLCRWFAVKKSQSKNPILRYL